MILNAVNFSCSAAIQAGAIHWRRYQSESPTLEPFRVKHLRGIVIWAIATIYVVQASSLIIILYSISGWIRCVQLPTHHVHNYRI